MVKSIGVRARCVSSQRAIAALTSRVSATFDVGLGVGIGTVMMHDLRLAVRSLRATPIVTFVAILSLALGIGANTAMFSLVDALVLRALPVREPQRLAVLTDRAPKGQWWPNPVWESIRDRRIFDRAF